MADTTRDEGDDRPMTTGGLRSTCITALVMLGLYGAIALSLLR